MSCRVSINCLKHVLIYFRLHALGPAILSADYMMYKGRPGENLVVIALDCSTHRGTRSWRRARSHHTVRLQMKNNNVSLSYYIIIVI